MDLNYKSLNPSVLFEGRILDHFTLKNAYKHGNFVHFSWLCMKKPVWSFNGLCACTQLTQVLSKDYDFNLSA